MKEFEMAMDSFSTIKLFINLPFTLTSDMWSVVFTVDNLSKLSIDVNYAVTLTISESPYKPEKSVWQSSFFFPVVSVYCLTLCIRSCCAFKNNDFIHV